VSTGAVVSEVASGSPAEHVGVQPYDVITEFAGQQVADSAELIVLIAGHKPGDVVPMTVVRGVRILHVEVTLAGAGPPSS
jgi:S1-C subfamily serine protease